MKNRLTKLEKAVTDLSNGVCPLCGGHPHATLSVVHESDPDGDGYRPTGDCHLEEDDRITDNLRCRGCGKQALQLRLMVIQGIGPAPTGRRLDFNNPAIKDGPV